MLAGKDIPQTGDGEISTFPPFVVCTGAVFRGGNWGKD